MQRMWAKIVQHRLVFLVGVSLIAAVLAALREVGMVSEAGALLGPILVLGLLVAALVALNARLPAAFLVREGTFTTPPPASAVVSAGMLTALSAMEVGPAIFERRSFGSDRFQIVAVVLMLLLLPVLWYSVLGRFGVFLRPDGVLDRQPLGSIFVPWEAGPAAQPTRSGVTLRIGRPDLVVRRGFRPGKTLRTGADRGFTAWAINLYTARPDYRPAIGTNDGLHQLTGR